MLSTLLHLLSRVTDAQDVRLPSDPELSPRNRSQATYAIPLRMETADQGLRAEDETGLAPPQEVTITLRFRLVPATDASSDEEQP